MGEPLWWFSGGYMSFGGGFTFSQVPSADIPRSVFNRSHQHKTTFDAGFLIPVLVDEALPGDTLSVNASLFARMTTPIVPLMDNLRLEAFFFAVPNRLLWDHWQPMMGERIDPDDPIDFLVPEVEAPVGGFDIGSLFDYLGVPTGIAGLKVSALFPRAYNLIWNEWFRDENLQDRVPFTRGDGPDAHGSYVLQQRGKRHDYFTSCLPWPQKGEAAQFSLGEAAPVLPVPNNTGPTFLSSGTPTGTAYKMVVAGIPQDSGPTNVQWGQNGPTIQAGNVIWSDPQLYADLSSASAVTINALREAMQVQRLMERDARGGTRYTELLRSHFGVVSPDQRVQRPEFLGGGSIAITTNPVVQTSSSTQDSPQGNLAAYSVGAGSCGFTKSFTEHCVVLGLVMVRADLTYQQGLPRMFSRRTRYDFYWPAFAHLGEQAVLNKELYAQGPAVLNTANPPTPVDDDVFGYQERWAEYRHFPSKITGKFRSSAAQSLDVWHLSQEFTELPALNGGFIREAPPMSRVLAVTDEPHFLFDSHFAIKAVRPMPTYSVPGLVDHF